MPAPAYRQAIEEYVRREAIPVDKLSHMERLYALAVRLAADEPYDDDVLHAAAWLHDLGVFHGHRPEDPDALDRWDNVAYAMQRAPDVLASFDFPSSKIESVVEAIRTHLPDRAGVTREGMLLRDADILEQLGAIGILRVTSKVGRDTRYPTLADAVRKLEADLARLPSLLVLPQARALAASRVELMRAFLDQARRDGV